MTAQLRNEPFVDEAFMTNLHGMPERAVTVDTEPASSLHARVASSSDRERRCERARQCGEKCLEARLIVTKLRRKLPQERPDLFAQIEYTRCEEVREDRKSTRLNSSHSSISYAV